MTTTVQIGNDILEFPDDIPEAQLNGIVRSHIETQKIRKDIEAGGKAPVGDIMDTLLAPPGRGVGKAAEMATNELLAAGQMAADVVPMAGAAVTSGIPSLLQGVPEGSKQAFEERMKGISQYAGMEGVKNLFGVQGEAKKLDDTYVNKAMSAVAEAPGDVAGMVNPSWKEPVDVATMTAMGLLPVAGLRPRPKGLSPEALAEIKRRMEAEKAPQPKPKEPTRPIGEQLELPLEEPKQPPRQGELFPIEEPLPKEMTVEERLRQRVTPEEFQKQTELDLRPEQPDLFASERPIGQAEQLRRAEQAKMERIAQDIDDHKLNYELTLEEPKAREIQKTSDAMRDIFPDRVNGLDVVDFPMRAEALAKDSAFWERSDRLQGLRDQYRALEERVNASKGIVKDIMSDKLEVLSKEIEANKIEFRKYLKDNYDIKGGADRPLYESKGRGRDALPTRTRPEQYYAKATGKDRGAFARSSFAKKQRGSLGDPEFKAFKDSLPPQLKAEAGAMWKEMNKMKKTELTKKIVAPKLDAIQRIVREVGDEVRPWEEVKADILKEPDINMGWMGRNLLSGSRMVAFAKENTAIRYMSTQSVNALRRSNAKINEYLLDKTTGLKPALERIDKKEWGRLWAVMANSEGKRALTSDMLKDMKFSKQAIAAHEKYREIMDKMFEYENQVRSELGLKPFEKRQGYIPSRWLGDYRIWVRDAQGNAVHVIGAMTKAEALKLRDFMKEKHPDYTFDEIQRKSISQKRADPVVEGYHTLLRILDDSDPRVQALESTFKEFMDKNALDYIGARKHFEPKAGLGGAEGFKELPSNKAAFENAKAGFDSSMKYVENMLKWGEIQRANRQIADLLKDADLRQKKPNTYKYIDSYWFNLSGKGTKIANAIDTVIDAGAEAFGRSFSSFEQGVSALNYWMTVKLFALNAAFTASQVLQPTQFVPSWASYLRSRGLDVSVLDGEIAASADLANLARNGKLSDTGKAAIDFAKENAILTSHILDDLRPKGQFKGWVQDILDKNLSAPEKFSRATAYLTYAHMLVKAGMEKQQAFRTAANLTDMSMTDYRIAERPLMYQNMGLPGHLMSALTTFKHNQYSQLYSGVTKANAPMIVTMLAANTLLAGLMGFYGREELDSIINTLNKVSASTSLDLPRFPTVSELLIKKTIDGTLPEIASFGGTNLMGIDMSSKFSAANIVPDSPGDFFFPYQRELIKYGKSILDFAENRDQQAAYDLALALTPSGLKAIPEALGEKYGVTQLPGGKGGDVRRDAKDWAARATGVRSTKESIEQQATRALKEENKFVTEKKASLLEKFKRTKDLEERQAVAKQYVKLGGEIDKLPSVIEEKIKSERTTEFQREKGLNVQSTSQAMKARRAKEYERQQP